MIARLALIIFLSLNSSYGATRIIPIGLTSNFSELSTVSFNPYGGYFRNGVMLALEHRSEELRKKNIELKLTEFDYGSDDLNVVKTVKKADKAGMTAVIGYNYSSNALIAAPLHSKLKLPMLSPSASANRLGSFGRYIHLGSFNNDYMAKVLAKFAVKELQAKKIAIITAVNCAYCTDLSKAFESEIKKNGGTIVKTIAVIQEDKSFNDAVTELRGKDYDAIFIPNQELTSARIILSLLEAGIKKPFLGADGWGNEGSEFFKVLNEKHFEGYSVTHWHPDLPTKESIQFVKSYQHRFGKLPNDTSVLAYDYMNFLINCVIKAPTLNRETLENVLASEKTFKGVTGRYLMSANKAPQKDILILKSSKEGFKIDRSYSLFGVKK